MKHGLLYQPHATCSLSSLGGGLAFLSYVKHSLVYLVCYFEEKSTMLPLWRASLLWLLAGYVGVLAAVDQSAVRKIPVRQRSAKKDIALTSY